MATRSVFIPARFAAALLLCFVAVTPAQKRPLTHKDYDAWRSIGGPTLSRDGKYLAYSWMPQEGDGDIVVVEIATGKEWRQPAGALPPPPVIPPSEINPEAPPPVRTVRILFTSDSKYLVATTFPSKAETEQAKKDKRKPEEMPKTGALVMKLGTDEVARLQDVKTVQVPEKGGPWLAYSRNPKPERPAEGAKQSEGATPPEQEDQRRAAGAKPATGGTGTEGRPEYGTDLILRDLTKAGGAERTFANALDFNFTRDGKVLWFSVSSRKQEENGFFWVAPGTDAAPAALLAGKGKYLKPVWNRDQTQLVFFSDRDDAASKTPKFKIYSWDRKAEKAAELITAELPGFPKDMVVSDKGSLAFSRDGSKLFVPAGPPPKPPKDAADSAAEEKVVMDLWHWLDDMVQPMQRVRANTERNRTYRGVYHLADGKYVQIASPEMQNFSASDDGKTAFGTDDRAYRRRIDYEGGGRSDIYQVDTATGAKKLVLKEMRGGFMSGGVNISPNGRYGLLWRDKQWHVIDAASGEIRNITQAIPHPLYDDEDDHPDEAPPFGNAGWTRDSQSVLVYDRFDVWQAFADGRAPRNVTEGAGRKAKIEFRVVRIDLTGEEDEAEDRYLDPSKPLYLRAEHQESYATGFYRDRIAGGAPPEQLLWGDKAYRFAARAKDAEVVLVSASRFDEYPDLHVTDLNFRVPRRITNGGKQMSSFLWGSAELMRFRNVDGAPLKAALFKPENFDPAKKYPLMVYIYEKMSQSVHGFTPPSPGTSINTTYYVSNGYVVLRPDIVYTVGQPGQSALKCVLPAIQEAVDRGFIDENAIGIQGHSWGGYQIAYMVTQTNRFKAAEAGAPVGNMTSAYSGIRWGSGMPRQFQYERAQSRIGRTLFEAPHKYLENSPIFHADRVKTPLLILHNDQDDAVPWYQGIELFLALRRNGKEAYLLNYNGEYHGLRRRHNQKDFTVRMQQFFDHHLKGAPKPEWMEKGVPFLEREEEKERFQKALSDR
jgi:dipeptidyl aminopeptidase/acylaminoacyl peptidase